MLGLSARTIGRFGAYRVLLAGLVLITAGMALLSRAPADGPTSPTSCHRCSCWPPASRPRCPR